MHRTSANDVKVAHRHPDSDCCRKVSRYNRKEIQRTEEEEAQHKKRLSTQRRPWARIVARVLDDLQRARVRM
jgi:hypothetical protein